MEGNHSASSGHIHQDDSWTCRRCGWSYPNARPSAKHRRNHKKHCGKIKGFELKSELPKGGSSDEASSDDGNHVDKESWSHQSSQALLEISKPLEASDVVVVDPPSDSQSKELPLPEANISNEGKSETPVQGTPDPIDVKSEIPACASTQNVDLTDVVKSESHIAEHVPIDATFNKRSICLQHGNIPIDIPLEKTSNTLEEGKDIEIKDLPGEPAKVIASDSLEVHGNVGLVALGGGADAALQDSPGLFSNQEGHTPEKDSMLKAATPKHIGSAPSSDESSERLEDKGRVGLLPNVGKTERAAQESQVPADSDQAMETQKKEISGTPHEPSNRHKGSSQEDDSWTCHRCGWVYPNPHPSARHRRNHKKHCGKLKGVQVQADSQKGGSSDEVSSDEEKKEHILDHSPQLLQIQNQGGGMTATYTTTSAGDLGSSNLQCRSHFMSNDGSAPGELPDGPNLTSVTTSVDSSNAEPKYTILPAQEDLHGWGQEKGAAADHTTIAPCDSQGAIAEPKYAITPAQEDLHGWGQEKGAASDNTTIDPCDSQEAGNFQAKEEKLSNEAVAPEAQLDAVSFLATSDRLCEQIKHNATELGSATKVADCPQELSGDCTVNVGETTSVLNLVLSDASKPADIGFSKAEGDVLNLVSSDASKPADIGCSKAEGDEVCAVVMPVIDAYVPGSAIESLEASAGAGSYQDLHSNEKTDSSLVKEVLHNSKSSNDLPPVPAAVNSPVEGPENLTVKGSSVIESISQIDAFATAADITCSANNSEIEEKFESVQAIPVSTKLIPKDEALGPTVGGVEGASSPCIDKVVETPQTTELPAQFSDKLETSVCEAVSEKERLSADTPKEAVLTNDAPVSTNLSLESKITSERVPTEDTPFTSIKDKVSGPEDASCSRLFKVVENPQVIEMAMESLKNSGSSEKTTASEEETVGDPNTESLSVSSQPDLKIISSESQLISNKALGDAPATISITSTVNDLDTSSLLKQNDPSLVRDTRQEKAAEASDSPVVLEKPGKYEGEIFSAAVSTTDTTEEMLSVKDNPTAATNSSESDFIFNNASSLPAGDTLATNTTLNLKNSDASCLPIESGFQLLSSVKDYDEEKAAEGSDPLQVVEKPGTFEREAISEERTTADITGEVSLKYDKPSAVIFSSESQAVASLIPVIENPETSFERGAISEERTTADITEEVSLEYDKSVAVMSTSESQAVASLVPVVEIQETSKIVDMPRDSDMSSLRKESDSNQLPLEHYFHEEKTTETSAPLEISEKRDSDVSSLPKESDSKQLPIERDFHEEKTTEGSAPQEVSETQETRDNAPSGTDFGSSDPSLDETDSFKRAESEFSACSEFATSSHKLSDSLEIFEDAPDTLEACSLTGSVDENESLDEPRQVADGVIEDSKLLKDLSLDKKVPGASNIELEQKPKVANEASAEEASSKEKAIMPPPRAATTSYAARSKMDELKAPSPEAWQEPGPSSLKKEGKKISSVEVTEDRKYSESHTALRSLMAKEAKEKTDEVVATSPVAMDLKIADKNGASANGTKPKSKLRSFFSHCICCSTVH